jgi:hypothetical protein
MATHKMVVAASAVVVVVVTVVEGWCKAGSMNLFLTKISVPLKLHMPL